jgi:hypothetical protein
MVESILNNQLQNKQSPGQKVGEWDESFVTKKTGAKIGGRGTNCNNRPSFQICSFSASVVSRYVCLLVESIDSTLYTSVPCVCTCFSKWNLSPGIFLTVINSSLTPHPSSAPKTKDVKVICKWIMLLDKWY